MQTSQRVRLELELHGGLTDAGRPHTLGTLALACAHNDATSTGGKKSKPSWSTTDSSMAVRSKATRLDWPGLRLMRSKPARNWMGLPSAGASHEVARHQAVTLAGVGRAEEEQHNIVTVKRPSVGHVDAAGQCAVRHPRLSTNEMDPTVGASEGTSENWARSCSIWLCENGEV